MRSCSRCTSSLSAKSSVITPFSCPVRTVSRLLDSRSKASPNCGSTPDDGQLEVDEFGDQGHLACSAAANAAIEWVSATLGRVRVNRPDAHSPAARPLVSVWTSQLHSAV
jgi:hypothetical protein